MGRKQPQSGLSIDHHSFYSMHDLAGYAVSYGRDEWVGTRIRCESGKLTWVKAAPRNGVYPRSPILTGWRRAMANVMAKERMQETPATLGDVLYAKSNASVPEQVWATLVQSIAAGDQFALHALYEMAHRIVFTLIMRITANRETTEELTIDVFHDIWRRASRYDPANGTVLGWIMNQARSRAIDRLRFENRKRRNHGGDVQPLTEVAADPHDVLELREQGEALRVALAALTPDERLAIEQRSSPGLRMPKPPRG
jgi:RNA polymerase sigma-70 factor (ECF subfamily)